MTDASDFSVDVFHGQLSPHVAQIYARIDSLPGGGEWELSGRVQGPECQVARTLPTTAALLDLGHGPSLMARATLVDPCFWSPELPAIYRVSVVLRERGRSIRSWQRWLGLRGLGASGRNFFWAGRRWVLRAVREEVASHADWSEWRELSAARVVSCPGEEACEQASRQGVLLVALVDAAAEQVPDQLRRLALWPAIGLALVESPVGGDRSLRHVAPNLLLASRMTLGGELLPAWAHAGVVDASQPVGLPRPSSWPVPLVATRPLPQARTLPQARDACDALQRDLAGWEISRDMSSDPG